MTAKGAAIALAILFGGFGMAAQDAEARAPDGRQGKPSTRAAAAPAPAAARREASRPANPTARAAAQRGQGRAVQVAATGRGNATTRNGRRGHAARGGGGISCVPYARQATGMAISGNGRDWWHNAAGLYARGNQPEVGSILAFPGSGAMRLGHVSVVERVVSSRELLVHHANWGGPGIRPGTIMRGVSVIDASPSNDWSQVRVQTGYTTENYGRSYPVYGFIYNRPDVTGGTMMAGRSPLRVNAAQAARLGLEEVAQAPARRR